MPHLISILVIFIFIPGIYHDAGSAIGLNEQACVYGTDEPIEGHGKGTITNIGETRKLFVGSGTNTLMGDVYIEMDFNLIYETQYNGSFVLGGTGISRASNGEEIHMTITGGSWYINFVPDPPETIFEISANLTGGTGKYKNAAGKFIATGTNIYVPSTPTTFDYKGTISY